MKIDKLVMKFLITTLSLTLLYSHILCASELSYERIDYVTASHEESMLDMRVKVQGGYINFERTYKQLKLTQQYANNTNFYAGVSGALGTYDGTNAERETAGRRIGVSGGRGGARVSTDSKPIAKKDYGLWIFNRNWGDLVFLDQNIQRVGNYSETGRTITWIDRNDFIYKRKNNGAYYEYQHNGKDHRITPTENGFRWTNREGDYIDYDNSGKATGYGNKNFVRVTFERNSQGLIHHIRDHNDNIVATWSYSGVRPIRLEDYTGRVVSYSWDGNDLTGVTTVLGDRWEYEYDSIGGNRVMVEKKDPEGQSFRFQYEVSSGGFRNGDQDGVADDQGGSAVGTRVRLGDEDERWDRIIRIGGARSAATSLQSMLMLTERLYPDGKKIQYDFFYDRDTETYTLIEINSDGYERERWFDLDGELRQELKGGLLAHRRVREGRRAVKTDPYGNKTTTLYTRWEAVERITFADGNAITVDYLPNFNFPTLITDELGVKIKLSYDLRGNLQRIEHGYGSSESRITEYEYDPFGNLTVERIIGDSETLTVTTRHTYDEYGNRTSTQDALGRTAVYSEFNALGQPQRIRDRRGHEWRATYDAAGNMLTASTPLGFVTRHQYDGLNRLIKAIDAEGREANYEYDSRNNLVKEINNAGDTILTTFRMDGQILSTTDESEQVNTAHYDRAARLIRTTDGTGNTVRYQYERGDELAGNRLQNAIFPNNQVFYTYDQRNRQIRERVASLDNVLADVTGIKYNARGDAVEITDGNGNVTKREFNVHGEITKITNAQGEVTQQRFDRRGNLLSFTDAEQRTTRFEYDANDNNVEEKRPLGETFSFSFDENNNLVRTIDPNGNITQLVFDDDDRPITETNTRFDETDPERTVSYSYDKTSLLTAYADESSSGDYGYDSLGRLTRQTINYGPFSKTLFAGYKRNGQLADRTDAEGVKLDYSYDAAGKFTQLLIPDEGRIRVGGHQGYLPTSISFPGGIDQTLAYDGLGRIEKIEVKDAAESTLLSQTYSYDVVGNIIAKTTGQGVYTYEYDKIYRLTSAEQPSIQGNQAYSYDANGNRVKLESSNQKTLYQFNENHELVRRESDGIETSSLHDRNGAVVEEKSAGIVTRYDYNSFARLARITTGNEENQQLVAEYDYDPFGRRISKTVGLSTTYYLYDGENLVGEYDQTGELITGYIHQPDSDAGSTALALKVPADGGGYLYRYYQTDYQDTPQQLVERNGLVAWQGNYDAFGRVVNAGGQADNRLRFPGQYEDAESGLHYNWNRYYNPTTGRYLSSDPIGLGGGSNTYTYALNNPTTYTDPTGEIVPLLLGGALWGAGISVGIQLIMNGGRWDCIDWGEVAMSALFGAAFNVAIAIAIRGIAAMAALARAGASAAARMAGRAGRGAGAGAARAGGNRIACFVEGTLISTESGLKPIQLIRVGDMVASKNEVTGEVDYKPVTRTFEFKDRRTVDLVLKDQSNNEEKLGVTLEHPFWLLEEGWTEAKNLKPGYKLIDLSGKTLTVVASTTNTKLKTTYNFEVADFHTYFVGKLSAWVHNMCAVGQLGVKPGTARAQLRRALKTRFTGKRAHHVIPWQMRNHPMIQKAAQGGFRINGANNGIALSRARHPSSHARYNNAVNSMLNKMWSKNPNMSSAQAAQAVQSYANTLKAGLGRSPRTLTPRGGRLPVGLRTD